MHDIVAESHPAVRRMNQAVKRNRSRFPEDFMFQLTSEESDSLRSHFVTLKTGRGRHRSIFPFAFTEQGVAMLSSVLRSKRAVQVNIEIMRAFVRLRQMLASNTQLATKLVEHGEKIRRPIQGGVRRHPPAHDAAAVEEEKNRICGRRKSRRLRPSLARRHFDYSTIPTNVQRTVVVFRVRGADEEDETAQRGRSRRF